MTDIGIKKEYNDCCPKCGSDDVFYVDENRSKECVNYVYYCGKCKYDFMIVYKFAHVEFIIEE